MAACLLGPLLAGPAGAQVHTGEPPPHSVAVLLERGTRSKLAATGGGCRQGYTRANTVTAGCISVSGGGAPQVRADVYVHLGPGAMPPPPHVDKAVLRARICGANADKPTTCLVVKIRSAWDITGAVNRLPHYSYIRRPAGSGQFLWFYMPGGHNHYFTETLVEFWVNGKYYATRVFSPLQHTGH
jgi:hypothetical protein